VIAGCRSGTHEKRPVRVSKRGVFLPLADDSDLLRFSDALPMAACLPIKEMTPETQPYLESGSGER
jgi:hypothetical protein